MRVKEVKTKKQNKNKQVSLAFNSRQEILEYIADIPVNNYSHSYIKPASCKFSWNDSINFLREGWSEGIKEVDIKVKEIEGMIDTNTIQYDYDVTGDYIDIGSYLQGVPECFLTSSNSEKQKAGIKIGVNLGFHFGITQESIYNFGAAILSLIDKLYQSHYIDLTFYIGSKNCMKHNIDIAYHVSTEQGYDRDYIAFILCNPAFLRRIAFAILEKVTGNDNCDGYGQAMTLDNIKSNDIWIPKLDNNISITGAKDYINTLL